jgi:lysyl-tRNA synthetase class 2
LLAAGCGDIYQICKAFRAREAGARHNPEFTLLEWYRLGLSLEQLIEEVAELVCGILDRSAWASISYGDLFRRHLGIDPHRASTEELESCARDHVDFDGGGEGRDIWLDLLMSHVIEKRLAGEGLVFVRNYPESQAALARLRSEGEIAVSERFELYVDGMELANGYCELADPVEQGRRFESDNVVLSARGEPTRPVDERLLAALESGFPDCAGVALGVDRLLMLRTGAARIEQVLSFDWSRS